MLRIATFNIENLDDKADDKNPSLDLRAPVLRTTLDRLDADILCLQEVHGQELPEHTSDRPKRALLALDKVLKRTRYSGYHKVSTLTSANTPYNERNLVILSVHPIIGCEQYRNNHIEPLQYRKVTSNAASDAQAKDLKWERPILHAQIDHPQLGILHIINLHLKWVQSHLVARPPISNPITLNTTRYIH